MTEPTPAPEDFVGYRLIVLADRLQRDFRQALAPLDLSPRQFSVLAVLAARPHLTSAELARAVLTTPQSMGPLLDQLAARGLVERAGQRRRGRAAPAQLSAAGSAVLRQAFAGVARLDADIRRLLGADHARLVTILDRLDAPPS